MSSGDDPIAILRDSLERASRSEAFDAARVALATVDARGRPAVRFVLVREIGPDGLAFYTNYESRKAEELARVPFGALAWHWSTLSMQVRVEGPVVRASDARSDAYFRSRPRESQIGAWASPQSRPLASREELVARVRELEERHAGKEVPRPAFWGGFLLTPERIELWYERPHRLHERWLYERAASGGFTKTLLAP